MGSLCRPKFVVATSAVVFLTYFWIYAAHSQSITPVGSAETFDVATWNIEWFGDTGNNHGPSDVDQQRENVEKIILESKIDLWALQEISDTRQFQRLLDSLGGPWEGLRATISGTQRIAFIYNTDVVFLRQSKHILETFSSSSNQSLNYFAGRPPLQITIDVTLPDTTVRLTVITVHMKCCADSLSHERRTKASDKLKIHVDFTPLASEPVIIMGDFNDELLTSIRNGSPSPYKNFSDDPDDFQFMTLPLEQQNIGTFCFSSPTCSGGSTIDHILITNELFPHFEVGSIARLESVLTEIPNFVNSTSDHMPVYARFIFPTNTGTDESGEVPARLRISNLFPNPTADQFEFTVETVKLENLLVEVYDVLGRKQSSEHVWPRGLAETRIQVDTQKLPAGIYFVRVSTGSLSSQAKFVRLAR
ncbi:MAG: hypothetical protein BMS9Abin05_1167 [Rhodothermia bacterium]|nr:MAG: hypothetical protein BMS9Abin05_1167 [Rhodothermia bacterium]